MVMVTESLGVNESLLPGPDYNEFGYSELPAVARKFLCTRYEYIVHTLYIDDN